MTLFGNRLLRSRARAVVERIHAPNPKLNAIVIDLTDQALAEAAAADRRLRSLQDPGPLFGVPMTIKVNVDQEGQATTNGLSASPISSPPSDSPVVRNLRRAGAIIVGRTNTPEVSMRLTTVNPLHGRTWKPWHPDASRVDRPAVPGLPRRRVSALFITATTLVVRYGSRHSPTAWRRSSQPRVESPHSILLQPSNAACPRSLHR